MMSTNPVQSELLELFEQTQSVIEVFIESRSEPDRAAIGTEKQWSAKDLLANVGCWMDYMVQRMAYFTRDEIPPRHVDFEAIHHQAFVTYQHRSWEAVLDYVRRSLGALIETVKKFTDIQLAAHNAYGDDFGGPLAGEIRANGFIYPLQEFEKFYQRKGDIAQAAEVQAKLIAVIGEEEPIVTDLISVQTLVEQQHQQSPLVIDVRGPKEYAAGHILGAINIPLAQLEKKLDTIAADSFVVTYCNMHHKGSSRGEQAALFLSRKGYRVAALDGGYTKWKDANLPTATD